MKKLLDYAYNVYSQFGEDGIIEKIFEILGTSSKVCIEFGAWDGFHLSNTANLWTNGWRGILIEADENKYLSLEENVKKYDCHCIKAFVSYEGHNTLENILKREGISNDIDFLSIDIDGDDYYIFESLKELEPRLIVCEYNPTIPAHIDLIPEKDNYFGCSSLSLVKLAKEKGYYLIAMTDTNCFFVRSIDFEKFESYDVNLESIASTKHLTYFITGYDGEYILSKKATYGCTRPSTQKLRGEYYAFPARDSGGNKKQSILKNYVFSLKRRNIDRNSGDIMLLKLLNKVLSKIASFCYYISKRLYTPPLSPQEKRVIPWFEIQGDKTLRLDYDLNEKSLVFDLGGYEGQWTSDIFSKYCCFVHVFEPVEKFSKNIEKRFYKNEKIIVHNCGLSNETKRVKITLDKTSSSIFKSGKETSDVLLLRTIDFMKQNNIQSIDLMKINIEGGEYDLLEHFIETGFINNIKNIQVQFHDFVTNAEQRMLKIQKKLEKTHFLTYQYPFVWENWRKK